MGYLHRCWLWSFQTRPGRQVSPFQKGAGTISDDANIPGSAVIENWRSGSRSIPSKEAGHQKRDGWRRSPRTTGSVMSLSVFLRPHGLQTRQAPLSMGFSRQEDWSGLHVILQGNLPDPGIEPTSPVSYRLSHGREAPLGGQVRGRNSSEYFVVLWSDMLSLCGFWDLVLTHPLLQPPNSYLGTVGFYQVWPLSIFKSGKHHGEFFDSPRDQRMWLHLEMRVFEDGDEGEMRWVLTGRTEVLIPRGGQDPDTHSGMTMWAHGEETPIYTPRREASGGASPAHTRVSSYSLRDLGPWISVIGDTEFALFCHDGPQGSHAFL